MCDEEGRRGGVPRKKRVREPGGGLKRGSGRDEQELCKIRMFFTGRVVREKGDTW